MTTGGIQLLFLLFLFSCHLLIVSIGLRISTFLCCNFPECITLFFLWEKNIHTHQKKYTHTHISGSSLKWGKFCGAQSSAPAGLPLMGPITKEKYYLCLLVVATKNSALSSRSDHVAFIYFFLRNLDMEHLEMWPFSFLWMYPSLLSLRMMSNIIRWTVIQELFD